MDESQKEKSQEQIAGGQAGESQNTGGGVLEVALEALERLTDAVEGLGQGEGEEEVRGPIEQLAVELRAAADRLSELVGGEVTQPEGPTGKGVAETVDAVRTLLQQVQSVLESAKGKEPVENPQTAADQGQPGEEPPAAPAAPADSSVAKGLSSVAATLSKLVELVGEQQQRLSRLEKRFGLPNSTPEREGNRPHQTDEVGWPMDLNRPYDKGSVDASVSFHDVAERS